MIPGYDLDPSALRLIYLSSALPAVTTTSKAPPPAFLTHPHSSGSSREDAPGPQTGPPSRPRAARGPGPCPLASMWECPLTALPPPRPCQVLRAPGPRPASLRPSRAPPPTRCDRRVRPLCHHVRGPPHRQLCLWAPPGPPSASRSQGSHSQQVLSTCHGCRSMNIRWIHNRPVTG